MNQKSSLRKVPQLVLGALTANREAYWWRPLKPKTVAFLRAFVPQFVGLAKGYVPGQFVALGLLSVALNILAAFAASGVRNGVAARPSLVRRLRELSGAAMVLLGVGLARARRPAN